jgi:hypothetical protein
MAIAFHRAARLYFQDFVGGKLMVWNGSAWQKKIQNVYTGSAWVNKPMYIWNGVSWVQVDNDGV